MEQSDMLDLVTLSAKGLVVARRLKSAWKDAAIHLHVDVETSEAVQRFSRTSDLVEALFPKTQGIVFIGPCGVIVRVLAPLIRSKLSDPPVVVVDGPVCGEPPEWTRGRCE
jgi:cobalt-precorrin 5A hydrolase